MRRPSLWALAATLSGLLVLLALGGWQLQRLAWKRELIAKIEAGMSAPPIALPAGAAALAANDYRRVRLTGVFLHDREAHVGPRSRGGRPGVHVLTPLRLADERTVLVNRGWVPDDRRDPAARPGGQLAATVAVAGILRARLLPGAWTPDYDVGADMWFWYDVNDIARRRGLRLLPAVLEAGPAGNPGGLPLGGVSRLDIRNDHLQYAITWFALAAGLLAVFVLAHRRGRGTP
ncbi:MAG: SURF1 family protein [Alphaproteobacteria bacterium]|nr:SURF1 family protein [Alphaproteobacteria bacterium]MDP6566066.1 SURF1 family protein [Alphaproteobacteria bacterium]MDP6812892.1 SURF1 family protein [Alphaproteobacteria bacterium]